MKYKLWLGPLLSLTFTSVAFCGTAKLSWTAPTKNTDGSPLVDLTSYVVFWGCAPSESYPKHVKGWYPNQVPVDGTATSHILTSLQDTGTCYFTVKAVNSAGIASAMSNEASKLMGTSR